MDQGALTTYNMMHVGYCVRVEWGFGGVKFWRLMEGFDPIKTKQPLV